MLRRILAALEHRLFDWLVPCTAVRVAPTRRTTER